jgi:hemerythrin-like metal-binding protein
MQFEWSPAFSVGIEQLDREHQYFFELVDRLGLALRQGCAASELGEILELLTVWTAEHFAHEQTEMRRNGYPEPETAAHLVEHEQAAEDLAGFRLRAAAGDMTLVASELASRLAYWANTHTLGTDMRFGAWLADQRHTAAGGH